MVGVHGRSFHVEYPGAMPREGDASDRRNRHFATFRIIDIVLALYLLAYEY